MSVEPKVEGSIVPILGNQIPVLQNPEFTNIKSRIERWLASPVPRLGSDMDSVFFNDDRFELAVDTRGYRPEDLKCVVNNNSIELIAAREEVVGGSRRNMSTTRSYQLPQDIIPQNTVCCLSPEGVLLIAAPWQTPRRLF